MRNPRGLYKAIDCKSPELGALGFLAISDKGLCSSLTGGPVLIQMKIRGCLLTRWPKLKENVIQIILTLTTIFFIKFFFVVKLFGRFEWW